MDKPKVDIFTDGSCLGNPGPGGWAAILRSGAHEKEISGAVPDTTNNRMEILAIIKALESLKKPCTVNLHSDSAYVINAFRQNWIGRWKKTGWMTTKKTAVENKDLWERLIDVTAVHHITWVHLKGHSGHKENERCDDLAKEAAKSLVG